MRVLSPILVVGHPRSGTSVVCGLLSQSGVWFGPHEPEVSNPTGTFENQRLRDLPGDGRPLVTWADVEPILKEQSCPEGGRWGVKLGDPRRWPRWVGLHPKTIKVRRRSGAIITSALSRKAMKGIPVPSDYPELLQVRIERALESMRSMPGITLWPEKLAAGDDNDFQAAFAHLDLTWDGSFFDPKLWHHF